MKRANSILFSIALLSAGPAFADGLMGATVVITNTFQGGQTDGAEVDVAGFGMLNNQFATVGDGMEIHSKRQCSWM